MQRLLLALPALFALVIGCFLLWGLDPERDPNAVPSARIMGPVPDFALPPIDGIATRGLSADDLRAVGEPVLVNVFASWCAPCRAEHAVLTRMARVDGVRLMGINYKDEPADAAAWLAELGNPYERIGSDIEGRAGIDWAISGLPETFVVDGRGVITYRHVGPVLSEDAQADLRSALDAARVGS
ncbi:MAG: DsbE family thiol:disulfide interchange protein [Shimia sp.]